MQTRNHYEQIEKQILAPYASFSALSRGREHAEEPHLFRTAFQRDRDRIIHSKAFRRLEYKTQVFVNHEGDHYRTRLTHSLEVAQISRSIARILRLNEDLVEAIALAHDLGHPPFGHSGEAVMNETMIHHGGFEHNRQSLRIVTVLERPYPEFPGLNLTYEVLEGMCKHGREYAENAKGLSQSNLSLEAQVVDLADEIAYNNHDLDDGLRSQMIHLEQLKEVEIWQEQYQEVLKKYSHAPQSFQMKATVKALINHLVLDLTQKTEHNLEHYRIHSSEDAKQLKDDMVCFSETTWKKTKELKKFLFKNLYRHYRVERMADKASRILKDLFQAYLNNPKILPPKIYNQIQENQENPERTICDYIAGMTDRFALEEHEKLFNPRMKV